MTLAWKGNEGLMLASPPLPSAYHRKVDVLVPVLLSVIVALGIAGQTVYVIFYP